MNVRLRKLRGIVVAAELDVREAERRVQRAEEGLNEANDKLREAEKEVEAEESGFGLTVADVLAMQGQFDAIRETDARYFEKLRLQEPTLKELVEFFA